MPRAQGCCLRGPQDHPYIQKPSGRTHRTQHIVMLRFITQLESQIYFVNVVKTQIIREKDTESGEIYALASIWSHPPRDHTEHTFPQQ